MSRIHLHIVVEDLDSGIRFYTALLGAEPTTMKDDYAKWELNTPSINLDISTRGKVPGLDHVGIQYDSDAELNGVQSRMEAAGFSGVAEPATACCYELSNKYWILDPTAVTWETFHSLQPVAAFSGQDDTSAVGDCCTPFMRGPRVRGETD
jgi:catechol 2,3-dioxygenase-like lactoylglutathione lyase family enzyme